MITHITPLETFLSMHYLLGILYHNLMTKKVTEKIDAELNYKLTSKLNLKTFKSIFKLLKIFSAVLLQFIRVMLKDKYNFFI